MMDIENTPLGQMIEDLTGIWHEWMHNHVKSNNEKLPYTDRFDAAMECEALQVKRKQIMLDIDEHIDGWAS